MNDLMILIVVLSYNIYKDWLPLIIFDGIVSIYYFTLFIMIIQVSASPFSTLRNLTMFCFII